MEHMLGGFPKKKNRKVLPSGLMIALSLVDKRLVIFVVLAVHVFLEIWLGPQMLETSTELALAILVHICCRARAAFCIS